MGAFNIHMRRRLDDNGLPCKAIKAYPISAPTETDALAEIRKYMPADRFDLVAVLPLADTRVAA